LYEKNYKSDANFSLNANGEKNFAFECYNSPLDVENKPVVGLLESWPAGFCGNHCCNASHLVPVQQ